LKVSVVIAPDVKQLAALARRARAPVRSSSRGGNHVRLNGTFGKRIVRARPPQSGVCAFDVPIKIGRESFIGTSNAKPQ
jgi:hypothetical protein